MRTTVRVPLNRQANVVSPGLDEVVESGNYAFNAAWEDDSEWPPVAIQGLEKDVVEKVSLYHRFILAKIIGALHWARLIAMESRYSHLSFKPLLIVSISVVPPVPNLKRLLPLSFRPQSSHSALPGYR